MNKEWSDYAYVAMAVAFAIAIAKLLPGALSGAKLWFAAGFSAFAIGLYAYSMYRQINREAILLWVFVVSFLLFQPLVQSYYVSMTQPPVMTQNWWHALNWIRENTSNCSVVATYWDFGHMITAVAQRPVVFDGASQNALLVINRNDTRVVRSRIKDIATVLFTSNETEAVDILRNYRIDHCDMYFIASQDLIMKSRWWSYFSTWDPRTHKGKYYTYGYAVLSDQKLSMDGKTRELDYSMGGAYFRLLLSNSSAAAYYAVPGRGMAKLKTVLIASKDGFVPFMGNGTMGGYLIVYGQQAVYVPEELSSSLFTRMFFFDGRGLEKFKLVKSWGNEFKLFKVDFGG